MSFISLIRHSRKLCCFLFYPKEHFLFIYVYVYLKNGKSERKVVWGKRVRTKGASYILIIKCHCKRGEYERKYYICSEHAWYAPFIILTKMCINKKILMSRCLKKNTEEMIKKNLFYFALT